ncbi:MAG: GNAT family N-acetyltransferase [Polyangiaceae bacterium]|nr:GNAT family N-acetyltransferase [Polyangiaceae bacterium]
MITVRPVTPADAARLHELFEAASCPCYCRYLHFDGDKNDWLLRCAEGRDQNRAELEDAVRTGSDEGLAIVALDGDAVVGWMKLSPAPAVKKAYEGRFYRNMPCFRGDRTGVYLLGCALVHPDHRRTGLATKMVRAAIDLARERGARAVEALPRRPLERVSDEELWTIPAPALEEAGLRVVGGEDPYPVLRIDLEPRETERSS